MPTDRFAPIDGLRALAAIYVMVSHLYITVRESHRAMHPEMEAFRFLAFGGFAVGLFITLSGFCLATPVFKSGGVLRGGYMGFMKRRARRILPPYYAALVLSLVLNFATYGDVYGLAVHRSPWTILTHVLMIYNVVGNRDASLYGDYSINGVFWSLAVEFQIYLIFPILVGSWRRIGPWQTLLASCTIAGAVQLLVSGTPLVGLNCVFYALFTAGMLAAWFTRGAGHLDERVARSLPTFAAASTVALFAFLCWKGTAWVGQHLPFFEALSGVVAFPTVMAAVTVPAWRDLLSRTRLVEIGGYSYSLYLIHMPLIKLMTSFVIFPATRRLDILWQLAASLLVMVPLCLVVSRRFSAVFEQPFIRRR